MTLETKPTWEIALMHEADNRYKRYVSVESILPDIEEIYNRLDKVMAKNEHKTSSAFSRVELSKLKQTVIDIRKELEGRTKE